MSTSQADVVKKTNLKVKVFKSKNGSAGLQGPKVFREFWFVFRALVGGDKILEYHQNERKFQECPAYPKGVLHLGSALAVSYHNPEKKQQFSIELAGGSIIFLEAAAQPLAREWLTCLNAVLFGKGTGPNGALQYFADVPIGNRLQYAGACMLEVKDEELTVKTNDGSANLVRWKLAHIRSFKAKKDMLTVYSGSRSSTGVGEYHFKSPQSVQITHAIETVVKKLKYESLGSGQKAMIPQHSMSHSVSAPGIVRTRPFISERRRPLPPPPPPSHRAPSPTLSPSSSRDTSPSEASSISSAMAAVPDHIPSEVIAENPGHAHNHKYIPNFRVPEYSRVGDEGLEYSTVGEPGRGIDYQRLDHGVKESVSPPCLHGDGYSHLSHQQRNSSRSRSVSHSPPPPLPPARQITAPREEYGQLDHSQIKASPTGDEYGRLDHSQIKAGPTGDGYGRLDHSQIKAGPTGDGYGRLDHSQIKAGPTGDGYGRLDHSQTKAGATGDGYGRLDHSQTKAGPTGDGYGRLDHSQIKAGPTGDEYGRLDHSQIKAGPTGDGYGRLDHSQTKAGATGDGYGRLDHSQTKASPTGDGYGRLDHSQIKAGPTGDGYGRLDHSQIKAGPTGDGYGRLDHSQIKAGPTGDGYGRLDHSQIKGGPTGDEYGRLDHSQIKGDEYGRLDRSGAPTGDEYGRLDHGGAPSGEEYGRLDHSQTEGSPTGDDYSRLDHRGKKVGPSIDEYEKLDYGPEKSSNVTSSSEDYGKLDHAIENRLQVNEGYSKLRSPGELKKPSPPPPYKPRPGSPLPNMNTTEGIGVHSYSEVSGTTVEQQGDVYSEIAPSVPKPGVSEGYGRLNFKTRGPTPGSTPAVPQQPPPSNATPNPVLLSSRQLSVKYSRLDAKPHPQPRPQSTIDPYASLSDAHIDDITDALRQEAQGPGDDGGYSRLGMVAPHGPSHKVDATGYSKPWTSFSIHVNKTPRPSLDGARRQNGTETSATEYEALYDKMEDSPPTPPPRKGSRRSHSPLAPCKGSRHSHSPPAPCRENSSGK